MTMHMTHLLPATWKKDAYKRLERLMKGLLLKQGLFWTFHARPVMTASVTVESDLLPEGALPSLGIVIQGGLLAEHDFTRETVTLYRRQFPDAVLVVSTWRDSPVEALDALREAGAEVVLSTKPAIFGVGNCNLQMVSTVAGLQHLQARGCKLSIKTRTDQRVYAPNLASYLWGLLELFPLAKGIGLKGRVVCAAMDSFKYRPYSLSDMFLYGHTEDLLRYFDAPLDTRTQLDFDADLAADRRMGAYARLNSCEIYFMTHFLKGLGHQPDFSVADSWAAYARYFCIADSASLDLYWPKYNNREYRWTFYAPHSLQELNFREWLHLYLLHKALTAPEAMLDAVHGDYR